MDESQAQITLVLLPGLEGTGALFAPLLAALGSSVKTSVVSYPPDEALGYDELETIARATLPQEGPFVILGESFSGPVAVALAASAPSRLRGLVLSCTFVRNPLPSLSMLKPLMPWLPVSLAPLAVLDYLLLGRFSTPTLRASLAQALASVSPDAVRMRLAAVLGCDTSALLEQVHVPVLYLRALQDRVVPKAASRWVQAQCSQVEVVSLPGPHCLLQAVPVQAAQVITDFVGRAGRIHSPVRSSPVN